MVLMLCRGHNISLMLCKFHLFEKHNDIFNYSESFISSGKSRVKVTVTLRDRYLQNSSSHETRKPNFVDKRTASHRE